MLNLFEWQKNFDFSREPIEAIMMFHDSRDCKSKESIISRMANIDTKLNAL
jgi:hypothetical protein